MRAIVGVQIVAGGAVTVLGEPAGALVADVLAVAALGLGALTLRRRTA